MIYIPLQDLVVIILIFLPDLSSEGIKPKYSWFLQRVYEIWL